MKKILPLLFALTFYTFCSHAQLYNNPFFTTYIPGAKNASKHKIQAGGGYDVASTGINNMLFNKYLYSNFLDDEAKESVLPQLRDKNRLGANVEGYLFYTWKKKKNENAGFYAMARSRRQYGSVFTDDAYGILLFGNARFAGRTATFDGSNYYRNIYQTFQAGMYGRASKKLTIGAGIGLARGSRYSNLNINKGSLFTSNNGDSLALHVDVDAQYANLKGNGNQAAGIGALANFFAVYDIDGKSYIQFAINDLGFIHYNKFSHTYKTDRQITYEGYEVSSYNNSFNSGNNELLPEKLFNEVDSTETDDAFTATLPTQFQVQYKQYLGKKTSAVLAAEYFVAAKHLPSFHININQDITKAFAVQAGVNLLGYGKVGINLNTSITIAKSWFLIAGTDHLEAIFSAKNIHGQGAYVSLGKGF